MEDNASCKAGTIYYGDPSNDSVIRALDSPEPAIVYPNWEIALKVTFYVVAIILDIVGNSIVIMIILLNRKMRTTTNLLLLNLAISDLMVGVFCMWVHLGNQITSNWPFGAFLCKFSTFSQVMSVTASVLTLTAISVERFIAVVFPFKSHWTPMVTGIIIGCTWVLSIATASPQLVVRKEFVIHWKDRTEIYCAESWTYYYKDSSCKIWMYRKFIYYLVEGIIMFFVPIAVIFIAYTMIAIRLLMRKAPGSLVSSTSTAHDKSKRKVTKMLIIVMTAFIICWTPQQTMLLYDLFKSTEDDYYGILRYVAVYIAYFNSALNPILYGGFNENFRKGFVEAFKCFLIQKRNKIGPDSAMPPLSGKPQSYHGGDVSGVKVMSTSQLTLCPGSSRDASSREGHLQPIDHAAQLRTTRTKPGPGLNVSENLHPNNGYLQPIDPNLQRKTA